MMKLLYKDLERKVPEVDVMERASAASRHQPLYKLGTAGTTRM